VKIDRLTPDDWATFRDVRLKALADAPYAFSSTLVNESLLDETRWRTKLATRAQFVARDDDVLGTAGAFREGDSTELISMWVAPEARHRGVGAALVTRVVEHARESRSKLVVLRVRVGNHAAERLYARLGFVRTGVHVDDGELEAEMVKAL
jgi:ribosomal protein S18 acetylase RimI-like enzyme